MISLFFYGGWDVLYLIMSWGIGQKGDKIDQSASHVRPTLPGRNVPLQAEPPKPQRDPRQEVKAFHRQLIYDQLVRLGKTPFEALRGISTKAIPIGTRITPRDIKNVIDTGQLQKKRI